ncbi:g5270 [Coccomyxa elongata]
MDCTPPIGGEVLPPLSHAPAAMEVEVQPPPSQPPSGSPTEWASPSSADHRAVVLVRRTATSQPSLETA